MLLSGAPKCYSRHNTARVYADLCPLVNVHGMHPPHGTMSSPNGNNAKTTWVDPTLQSCYLEDGFRVLGSGLCSCYLEWFRVLGWGCGAGTKPNPASAFYFLGRLLAGWSFGKGFVVLADDLGSRALRGSRGRVILEMASGSTSSWGSWSSSLQQAGGNVT